MNSMKQKHCVTLALMTIMFLLFAAFCATQANAQEPWAYKKPTCLPKAVSEVRWTIVGTRFVMQWYCDKPRGIMRYVRGFDAQVSLSSITALTSKGVAELYALDKVAVTRALSSIEWEISHSLHTAEGPKGRVINSGYTTAPTYAANSDGTRGTATAERVTVGTPCIISRRLVTIADGVEAGTNYYAVSDTLYARCSITGAVSK